MRFFFFKFGLGLFSVDVSDKERVVTFYAVELPCESGGGRYLSGGGIFAHKLM